ncbi:MAG: V-type ATP synthase subunit F [Sulfolobales archaeon]
MSGTKKLKLVAVVKKELVPLVKTLGTTNVVGVDDSTSASTAVEELLQSDDVAVIVVQKSLLRTMKLPAEVHTKLYPILVEIPDEPGDLTADPREYYRDLIRKFIGYEIHLGG